jgi:hypothetical protein
MEKEIKKLPSKFQIQEKVYSSYSGQEYLVLSVIFSKNEIIYKTVNVDEGCIVNGMKEKDMLSEIEMDEKRKKQ